MHLNPQNLDTAAHKCTTNTHFIQYSYTFSKDDCAYCQVLYYKYLQKVHTVHICSFVSLLFVTFPVTRTVKNTDIMQQAYTVRFSGHKSNEMTKAFSRVRR